jgi:hypothetical protein
MNTIGKTVNLGEGKTLRIRGTSFVKRYDPRSNQTTKNNPTPQRKVTMIHAITAI